MLKQGFTVVELLIVIVVISILATITIVAYNGVQNRANDTAVQADLRVVGSKIEVFHHTGATGLYPDATQTDLQSLVRFNKTSYLTPNAAGSVSYCRNNTDYTLLGRSASKNAFIISSQTGLKSVTFTGNLVAQCALGGIASTDPGYNSIWLLKGTGNPEGVGWQSWVN